MRVASSLVRLFAKARPAWVVGATWILMLVLAYPGVMTFDSTEQLAEARSGIYSDAHPPAMAWLWSVCEIFVRGPFGMLVLQTGLFVTGCFRLLATRLQRPVAAWLTCVICLLPQNLPVFFAVWKDSMMAGFVMFGLSWLVAGRSSDAPSSRWRLLIGLVFIALGTAMRHNAFAATVPLVFLVFEVRPQMPWLKRYALSLAASVAVVIAAFSFNTALTSRKLYFWYNSVAIMDIVGTLHRVSPELSDSELAQRLAGTRLRVTTGIHAQLNKLYREGAFLQLIEGEAPLFDLPMTRILTPLPIEVRDAVFAAWWSTISDYLREYLGHRVTILWGHIHSRAQLYPRLGELSRCQRIYLWMATRFPLSRLLWFIPLLVVVGIVGCRDAIVRALVFSGLGLEASLFFIAPATDYRYGHWLVVCALCALALVAAGRGRWAAARTSIATT